MKKYNLSLILSFSFFLLTVYQVQSQHSHSNHRKHSQEEPEEKLQPLTGMTDIIYVYGNCGMCKNRIENSLTNISGIHSAEWDVDTKVMIVMYDFEVISKDEIKKTIAAVGHDTDKFQAEKTIYDNLPKCCQYVRFEN